MERDDRDIGSDDEFVRLVRVFQLDESTALLICDTFERVLKFRRKDLDFLRSPEFSAEAESWLAEIACSMRLVLFDNPAELARARCNGDDAPLMKAIKLARRRFREHLALVATLLSVGHAEATALARAIRRFWNLRSRMPVPAALRAAGLVHPVFMDSHSGS